MLFMVFILLGAVIYIAIDFICWPEKTGAPTGSGGEDYIYTEADSGVIQVPAGQEFVVDLEGNITTGFQWGLQLDSNFIEFKGKEYIADETEGEIVGAGGHEKFTFWALTPGQTEIIFNYARPGESVQPEKTIVFNLTITE